MSSRPLSWHVAVQRLCVVSGLFTVNFRHISISDSCSYWCLHEKTIMWRQMYRASAAHLPAHAQAFPSYLCLLFVIDITEACPANINVKHLRACIKQTLKTRKVRAGATKVRHTTSLHV